MGICSDQDGFPKYISSNSIKLLNSNPDYAEGTSLVLTLKWSNMNGKTAGKWASAF